MDRGVDSEAISAAEEENRLDLLVLDSVVLPPARYTRLQIAELSGMSLEENIRLWRALGFADVGDDEVAFTDADLEAVTTTVGLLHLGLLDMDSAIQLARVIGSSMVRVAEAEITTTPTLSGDLDQTTVAELFTVTSEWTLPSVARLLEYAWRRHLQAAARRAMLNRAEQANRHRTTPGLVSVTVGFADLVGFTALSQQLSEAALAEIVGRFETLAYDTVTGLGGRVVKMIGDEVMFVVDRVDLGALIALSLSSAYADDELLSDVRVALACGDVLARDGDYYGPVVNLASRMVNIARPGSVLASVDVHDALRDDDRFEWRALRPRPLKDLGRVHLWSMRPADVEREGRRRKPGVLLGPEGLKERAQRLRDRAVAAADAALRPPGAAAPGDGPDADV